MKMGAQYSFVILFFAFLMTTYSDSNIDSTKLILSTVKTFDLSKYLGLWYQMNAGQMIFAGFEKDARCSTAFHEKSEDGGFKVYNRVILGDAGAVHNIVAQVGMFVPDASEPGRLVVILDRFSAPYWILELGPVNANGLYDYAIVGSTLFPDLSPQSDWNPLVFVLARDVETFNTKYQTTVTASLAERGFWGPNMPISIYQGKDCAYDNPTN